MPTARSEELRALAQRVADAFPPEVIEVVLTGSVSRGVADEVSDIELLAVTEGQLSLEHAYALARGAGLERCDSWGDPATATRRVFGYLRGGGHGRRRRSSSSPSDRATEALRRRMSPELGAARRALAWAGVPEWPPTGLLREPPRKRENPLVGRADTPVRLGYWSYLGLGSLLMLILSLIYASWTIAALAVVVLALATHRLYVLRTDPDE